MLKKYKNKKLLHIFNLKSQAALEFLTTYGWAFLVILIMIAALSYFGILSPSKLLPDRCNFGPEFSCTDYGIGNDGAKVRLRNNVGQSIIVDSFEVSAEKSSLSCTSPITGSTWKAGETKGILMSCNFANSGLIQGDKGKLNLKITYHLATGSSAFAKDVNGELFVTLQSKSVLPTSCLDALNNGLSAGDGVYTINPGTGSINVYCDMTTNGGGWTLVVNVAPADGNSVGYNNQAFWTTDAEYGNFANRFSNDYKSSAAYTLSGTYLMIQSAITGASGSVIGWRRWPMTSTRTFDSFFSTGIVAVHATDTCETGNADSGDVGTTSSWDDIIRQGNCLYADVNPSASGEADLIRLTVIPYNSQDNMMAGFGSCIDCGVPWQAANPYMGLDRAGCNTGGCAYSQICRVPGADCLGNYCTNPSYSTTPCGMGWNSRIYVK